MSWNGFPHSIRNLLLTKLRKKYFENENQQHSDHSNDD